VKLNNAEGALDALPMRRSSRRTARSTATSPRSRRRQTDEAAVALFQAIATTATSMKQRLADSTGAILRRRPIVTTAAGDNLDPHRNAIVRGIGAAPGGSSGTPTLASPVWRTRHGRKRRIEGN
jgi:hypothetical protein